MAGPWAAWRPQCSRVVVANYAARPANPADSMDDGRDSSGDPIGDCVVIGVIRCVVMAVTSSRPGFAAHTLAVRSTFPEAVGALRELLGPQLVAYLGSVRETRAVHQWAEGDASLPPRCSSVFGSPCRSPRCWPRRSRADRPGVDAGTEPALDDRSPARLLREGDVDEVGPAVIGAARAFLIGG